MNGGAHKLTSVPPTDVQMALAWAAGSSVAELSLLGQHHIRVLAEEVRHLQAEEWRLLEVLGNEECPDISAVEDSGGGLQTWEKVMLAVVVAAVLLAGGALLWLTMMMAAATGNAEAGNSTLIN